MNLYLVFGICICIEIWSGVRANHDSCSWNSGKKWVLWPSPSSKSSFSEDKQKSLNQKPNHYFQITNKRVWKYQKPNHCFQKTNKSLWIKSWTKWPTFGPSPKLSTGILPVDCWANRKLFDNIHITILFDRYVKKNISQGVLGDIYGYTVFFNFTLQETLPPNDSREYFFGPYINILDLLIA